jgi:hypothetical protein
MALPDGRTVRLPRHGTRERYQHRNRPCSCELCRQANARYARVRRATLARQALEGRQLTLLHEPEGTTTDGRGAPPYP